MDVEFPMEVRRVVAHQKVRDDRGRMAIERGPIVFCAEWPDYEGGRILTLLVDPKSELKPMFDPAFYQGVTVLHGQAKHISMPNSEFHPIKLIPYYLWANRDAGEMAVWLSKQDYEIGDIGPAGGIIFYVNKNYAVDGWRFLEASPRDQSAGAKWGSFRTPMPGAYGTAVGTGKQNTADILAACKTQGIAADLCAGYSLNGVRDWFLPSSDELVLMYTNSAVLRLTSTWTDAPTTSTTGHPARPRPRIWLVIGTLPTTVFEDTTTTRIVRDAFGQLGPFDLHTTQHFAS